MRSNHYIGKKKKNVESPLFFLFSTSLILGWHFELDCFGWRNRFKSFVKIWLGFHCQHMLLQNRALNQWKGIEFTPLLWILYLLIHLFTYSFIYFGAIIYHYCCLSKDECSYICSSLRLQWEVGICGIEPGEVFIWFIDLFLVFTPFLKKKKTQIQLS